MVKSTAGGYPFPKVNSPGVMMYDGTTGVDPNSPGVYTSTPAQAEAVNKQAITDALAGTPSTPWNPNIGPVTEQQAVDMGWIAGLSNQPARKALNPSVGPRMWSPPTPTLNYPGQVQGQPHGPFPAGTQPLDPRWMKMSQPPSRRVPQSGMGQAGKNMHGTGQAGKNMNGLFPVGGKVNLPPMV